MEALDMDFELQTAKIMFPHEIRIKFTSHGIPG